MIIPFEQVDGIPAIEPIPGNHVTLGTGDGPTIIIMGGMHGNEVNGVTIVTRLYTEWKDKSDALHGTLHLVIANPYASAIEKRGRTVEGELIDANRLFASPDQISELQRAQPEYRRIREILSLYKETPPGTVMIDVHSLRWPSETPFVNDGFIISRGAARHKEVARLLHVPRHVATPTTFRAPDGSSFSSDLAIDFIDGWDDESAMTRYGFTLETGYAGDAAQVEDTYKSVVNALTGLGMIAGEATVYDQEFLLVTTEINAAKPFTWNEEIFPLQTGDHVAAGTLLGTYDDGEEVRSPDQEMIAIFPNENPDEVFVGAELIKFASLPR